MAFPGHSRQRRVESEVCCPVEIRLIVWDLQRDFQIVAGTVMVTFLGLWMRHAAMCPR
jgi:hypothetical protein